MTTEQPTTWRRFIKPSVTVLIPALLAGGLVYGIRVSLRTAATTTTASTVQAARAQVLAMSALTNSTAQTFGAAAKACHANITCVNNAASAALAAQGQAAGMVTLNLYPDATTGLLQNVLDDYVALQKTYLKVAEATTMPKAYTALQPWPGEMYYSKLHTTAVLDVLK